MPFKWQQAADGPRAIEAADKKRLSNLSPELRAAALVAIEATKHRLPVDRGIFELARRMRAHERMLPIVRGQPHVPVLQHVTDLWCELVGVQVGEQDEAFGKFLRAWEHVRSKGDSLADAVRRCAEPGSWPAAFKDGRLNHLLALACQLAGGNGTVFYLSTATVAATCGFPNRMSAHRALRRLVGDGWLQEVDKGIPCRKATRFVLARSL